MRILIFLILACPVFNTVSLLATAQQSDFLIYKGEKLALFSNPLTPYLRINNINLSRYFNGKTNSSTACWRGYVATWAIENDSLFLLKIQTCENNEDGSRPEVDLKELFGTKFSNNKVFADWVIYIIYAPFGKQLFYVHMGYASIYEYEYRFNIVNGKVKEVDKLDNRKTKQTIFNSENSNDTLDKFINSKINWSCLTKLPKDSIVKVDLYFSADENGIIDIVKVEDTIHNEFTNEAISVVKCLPSWDVYFIHGKHVRDTINYTVSFIQPIDNEEKSRLIEHDKRIGIYSIEQKKQIINLREKICDSIKVLFYNEYRKKDSRDYLFTYTFIDYTQNNKYIQKVLSEKRLSINESVIRDAQSKQLIKHDRNILKSIAPYWYPLTYYQDKFLGYKDGSRFYCSFTDSIINTSRRYSETYIISGFEIVDKNHYKFKLTRFNASDSLDVYFLDKNHKYALMRFEGKFQLFTESKEFKLFPILTYSFDKWSDIYKEFECIDSENNKLPKDFDTLKSKIAGLINYSR